MTQAEWVQAIAHRLRSSAVGRSRALKIRTGLGLAYSYEIVSYQESSGPRRADFKTDLASVETTSDGSWKPRVVIAAKIQSVTTHDTIMYSHKAATHRSVHPYVRYGVILGGQERNPLSGRLVRRGARLDFMISFRGTHLSADEFARFIRFLRSELTASRNMERILYESRKRDRHRYTFLHRRLVTR